MSPRHKNSRYYSDNYFEPSKPLKTNNGIKAKSTRGKFTQTWWADQFIHLLESFGWKNRLQRGKNYARQGQVLDITIKEGIVISNVQGSRPKPYKVTISFIQYNKSDWQKIASKLSEEALISASLLTGEMPNNIDEKIKELGFKLLPHSESELKTNCTCPDSANPCKHIAAVYYILGERFDDDPFLLFELRGIQKDVLLELLRKYRHEDSKTITKETNVVNKKIPSEDLLANELTIEDLKNFWGSEQTYQMDSIQTENSPQANIIERIFIERDKVDLKKQKEIKKILVDLMELII